MTEIVYNDRVRYCSQKWRDDYPAFLVDKVKDELQKVIDLLESGETDIEVVQETLDEAVCGINDLQEEFDENDSEIETVARDCIGVTVAYILEWFGIPRFSAYLLSEENKDPKFRAIAWQSLLRTIWGTSSENGGSKVIKSAPKELKEKYQQVFA